MVLLTHLLPAALFSLGVAASPAPLGAEKNFITLPISRHLNHNATSAKSIVQKDLARARAMKSGKKGIASRAVVSAPVTNVATTYVAQVGVGSPPTYYSLIVDTGSSNTWVGAGQQYVETATSVRTDSRVDVTYGSGSFSGSEYIDTVELADGLVINRQSIGVASRSEGFDDGVDGILGLGPTDLTEGTLSPGGIIPTVVDNLFGQGTINSDVVAISFEPTTTDSVVNGELTFGGVDASKFTGNINYTPITFISPSNGYWGIDQRITYGGTTILFETAGIVDTGSTLILLATDAFNRYQIATGAVLDQNVGLLRISSSQYSQLRNLDFRIGGETYSLIPDAQIWPRALNSQIGGNSDSIYLVVSDLGTPSGEGLDFINGYTWLERFYSVYDTGNRRVGLATTPFTNTIINN
ncbi:acid protease [Roridomyces roridus]|uniref:Acid protease n=1 Tax=Roridomyces roridus TaxID=1738132 RepID=A0AAD7FID8_9AGAR|nr:acid protease [Roridomyces roridus]